MTIRASRLPNRRQAPSVNLFTDITTPQERHTMQSQAAQTCQLIDERRHEPEIFTRSEANALAKWGRDHGWHFWSRQVDGDIDRRRIWVAWDPKHGKRAN